MKTPTCPWCGYKGEPVPNDYDQKPKVWRKHNPWKCPECGEVGDGEDWGLLDIEDIPSEDDLVTYDHSKVFQNGKVVLETTPERFDQDVRAFMDREKFWPNVWWISDHGNAHLLSIPETDTPRMMPEQEPYTPEELARLQTLVSDAASEDPGESGEEAE